MIYELYASINLSIFFSPKPALKLTRDVEDDAQGSVENSRNNPVDL